MLCIKEWNKDHPDPDRVPGRRCADVLCGDPGEDEFGPGRGYAGAGFHGSADRGTGRAECFPE